MPIKNDTWFEFTVRATSADYGNIWPTRRVHMPKSRADLFAKQNMGKIVDGPTPTEAEGAKTAAEDDDDKETIADRVKKMKKAELEAEIERLNGEAENDDEKIVVPDGATVPVLKELVTARLEAIEAAKTAE